MVTITIDGPSGTGKSTVAKRFAQMVAMAYFDTGALYRAIAWKILQEDVDLHDREALKDLLRHFSIECGEREGKRVYSVDGVDVTEEIRMQRVTEIVSAVSAIREVREALRPLQEEFAQRHSAIFEGRDLGSVVFPQADLKFFLTARPEVRAQRRFEQLKKEYSHSSQPPPFEKVLADIVERDRFDSSREIAPLRIPTGAIVIDTSDLSIEEVALLMKKYYQERKG